MLTAEQSDRLESLQKKALKTIYGWNRSYIDILSESGISSLKERREFLFKNFADKCSRDSRFAQWFPSAREKQYNTRSKIRFDEPKVRTERMRNSPVLSMIRLLNRETGSDG